MTISNPILRNDYTASAGQTVFPYTFRLLDQAHVQVYVKLAASSTYTLKTLTTHYTVSSVGETGGGNITFLVGLAVNDVVAILLGPDFTQLTDYQFNSPFPEQVHETALDKLTQLSLVLKGKLARALKFADFSTRSDILVPEPQNGKFLRWKADLTALENVDVGASTFILGGASTTAIGPGAAVEGASAAAARLDHNHLAGLTAGRVPFATAAAILGDASQLAWDDATKKLTITGLVHITGTIANAGPGVSVNPTFTGATDGAQGFVIQPTFTPSVSISFAYGLLSTPTFNPGAGVTLSNCISFYLRLDTGSGAGAITSGVVAQIAAPILGTLKPANISGIKVENQGSAGVTTAISIEIFKPTGAANNFYFSFDVADATAAGTYFGRIPIRYAGALKFVHIFNA